MAICQRNKSLLLFYLFCIVQLTKEYIIRGVANEQRVTMANNLIGCWGRAQQPIRLFAIVTLYSLLWIQTPLGAIFDEIYFVQCNLDLSDNLTEMRQICLS